VKGQAERMLKLVTELLDVSRIEAERLPLYRQPIDLASVIEEVKAHCELLIGPRKFTLDLGSVPPVYGDRDRLGQVVENLLTNAVKFTPPEGSITVGLTARGSSAELSVSDTGIGMSKKEQLKLFQKFFQPKVPAALSFRGTGLGLSIVKEMVQLHGGTIRVASEPGEGTTFKVSLPLYTPAFALTEEFRLMRQEAAREGRTLAVQLLQARGRTAIPVGDLVALLNRHVSREDRVLENPRGGVVILSVLEAEDFPAMRRRIREVLGEGPEEARPSDLAWGWALVPREETTLPAVLELAKRRAWGESQPPLENALAAGGAVGGEAR